MLFPTSRYSLVHLRSRKGDAVAAMTTLCSGLSNVCIGVYLPWSLFERIIRLVEKRWLTDDTILSGEMIDDMPQRFLFADVSDGDNVNNKVASFKPLNLYLSTHWVIRTQPLKTLPLRVFCSALLRFWSGLNFGDKLMKISSFCPLASHGRVHSIEYLRHNWNCTLCGSLEVWARKTVFWRMSKQTRGNLRRF